MTQLVLRTAIGSYPHTQPLKDGTVQSERVRLAHEQIEPVNRAFRPMVNDLAFDVSEMALVTHMLATDRGRRLVGLPMVLMQQPALSTLVCRADSPIRGPDDLAGGSKTIGVRAYTQTTGVWARAFLSHAAGLDLAALRWVTVEPAHVDGFQDPPNVSRAESGVSLVDLLLKGRVDALIGVEPTAHPQLRPVLPDWQRVEADWIRQTGVQPINHVLVLRQDLAEAHPWLERELMELFGAARHKTEAAAAPPIGLDAMRDAVDALACYAAEQGIVTRRYTAAELFAFVPV